MVESNGKSSAVNFTLDELIKLLPGDHLTSVSTNRVNDLNELVIRVAVLELLIDIAQIVEV